ncbi:hypothetical protein BH11CYA1_BH11CYA1_00460 [soil metagenome]
MLLLILSGQANEQAAAAPASTSTASDTAPINLRAEWPGWPAKRIDTNAFRGSERWSQERCKPDELGSLRRPTRDGMAERSDNIETPWEQLERVLSPATPEQLANMTIKTTKLFKYIGFKGLPDFSLDVLPRIANPGAAPSQVFTMRMTLEPEYIESPPDRLLVTQMPFGIGVNGVLIIRGDNDYWKLHNRTISSIVLDMLIHSKQPTLIGCAADGYPIYGPYGYKVADDNGSELVELKTSFRIKAVDSDISRIVGSSSTTKLSTKSDTASSANLTSNDSAETTPLVKYEFIEKLGDLDDYNGRFGVTPEYPHGTYYYVVSNSFPYIPIAFRGIPDKTFLPLASKLLHPQSKNPTLEEFKKTFPFLKNPFDKLKFDF